MKESKNLKQAVKIIANSHLVSISFLQKKLKIGFFEAANLLKELESKGIVSGKNSIGCRKVLMRKH